MLLQLVMVNCIYIYLKSTLVCSLLFTVYAGIFIKHPYHLFIDFLLHLFQCNFVYFRILQLQLYQLNIFMFCLTRKFAMLNFHSLRNKAAHNIKIRDEKGQTSLVWLQRFKCSMLGLFGFDTHTHTHPKKSSHH